MPRKKRKVTNIGGVKTVGPVSEQKRNDAQAAQLQSDIDSGLVTVPKKLKRIRKRRREGLLGGR